MSDHSTDRQPADPGAAPAGTNTERLKTEQDLRATTDAIQTDIEKLASLEARKSELDPESPEVDDLSAEAVDVAERIHRETQAERQLSNELA